MHRSALVGFSLLFLVSIARAESILDDQFLILDPALSVSVEEDQGTAACQWEAEGYLSFTCGSRSLADGDRPRIGSGVDALGRLYRLAFKRVPIAANWCTTDPGFTNVYDLERLSPSGSEIVVSRPLTKGRSS